MNLLENTYKTSMNYLCPPDKREKGRQSPHVYQVCLGPRIHPDGEDQLGGDEVANLMDGTDEGKGQDLGFFWCQRQPAWPLQHTPRWWTVPHGG